jgi:uncharacterized protein YukE
MKFAMGNETLRTLGKQTAGSTEDLGGLVRQLSAAADPLEGQFNGAARQRFDSFKFETDRIADELNAALAAVLGGITGQDRSFVEGEMTMADETAAAQAGAAFDAAKFSGKA